MTPSWIPLFSAIFLITAITPPHSPIGHTPLEHRRFLRSPIYERSMDIYRALWKEKVFDILVTRFTNLAEQLEKEGIPHVLLMPSSETILEHFHALLADIKESLLQNSLVACCIVKVPAENQSQETYDRLRKALDAFSMKHSQNILIRKNGPCFEVTTSSMEVKSLTQNYTQCLLSSELHKALPFPPELGWGIGFDIVAAYKNAKRALAECSRDKHHYTYLVTESQEMVGPLNSNRSISYGLQPDAHVFSLAKSLGIAAVNLEKLMSLQKTRNMYEFTSGDLVYFLEITPRSAARILLKLADGGLARPVRTVNLNGAGRPSTVYEIDFGPFLS